MRRILLPLLATSLGIFTSAAQTPDHTHSNWVGTWGASPAPQLPDRAAMSKEGLIFENQTLREIVHVSVGGSELRVRLSNAYNKQQVKIGAVHLGLSKKGAAIVAGSDHTVTFSGQSSITIPPDATLLSDPIAIEVPAEANLAISLFLPKKTLGAGIHYSAQQTNYTAAGDVTSAADLPKAKSLTSWAFLTGIDTAGSRNAGTLVAFGDSITDGAESTTDANHRWPNFLATRLLKQKTAANIGVLDEGIGGNRILHDPNAEIAFGVNALARFDRDVLSQPGVKYVIVLEGINDLGHAGPRMFPEEQASAEEIIAGLKQMVERAHERGLKIFGATLTPFEGTVFPGYFSPAKEVERKKVNAWIRTGKAFDGVIDFDKAVQDRTHPDRVAAQFDSGDHLHPKDEGYRAMAESIDLSLFR